MFELLEKSKESILFILGTPIVLLLLFGLLLSSESKTEQALNINPYAEDMPYRYVAGLANVMAGINQTNESIKETSKFYAFVLDDPARRELVIVKETPTKRDLDQDFSIKLSLKNRTQNTKPGFITQLIKRNASSFNYHGKSYAVFNHPLPFVAISKIEVEQKLENKKGNAWLVVLDDPFPNNEGRRDFGNANLDGGKQHTPNIYNPLLAAILRHYNIEYLKYTYKVSNNSMYQVTETLSEFVNSSKHTLITIENQSAFWDAINSKDPSIESLVEFKGGGQNDASALIKNFISGVSTFEDVFHVEELSHFYAIMNLFSVQPNQETLYLMYSAAQNKIKPVYTFSSHMGNSTKFISKSSIDNRNFIVSYIKASKEISDVDFELLLTEEESVLGEIKGINYYYPKMVFSMDYLSVNQMKIKKGLMQSTMAKSALVSITKDQMIVTVHNVSYYPIQILGLNHKEKKQIIELMPKREIRSGQRDTIRFDLPRSFENLFVRKKSKSVGFLLHKHIYDLSIEYQTIGLNKVHLIPIIPYQEKENVEFDLFRSENFVNIHDDLTIDEVNKSISFGKKDVVISEPLIISGAYTFDLKPNTKIDIVNGGKIISYAPLRFMGTRGNSITISSSDQKGQGLIVLNASRESKLNWVEFSNLSNPSHGLWSVTGAVTFYESPVNLYQVTFSQNTCEDALNIVRTNFYIKSCRFEDTQSDAFDGDFVSGTILDCKFDNLGNDAIDISGSDILVSDVVISRARDKALSAGEGSKMRISNVVIMNSEIAIAGKDLSVVEVNGLEINSTKLGFTAFQKKPEFGPSRIIVNGLAMTNIETNYLIESSSSMILEGQEVETTQHVKDRMYGVEFGRSSAETRKSRQNQ